MSKSVDGPADLFRQLVDTYAQQLEQFSSADTAGGDEKQARTLLSYAKALESITTIGIKQKAAGAVDLDPASNGTGGLATGSKAGDTAELDRQLAQLVSNLVQAGKAE